MENEPEKLTEYDEVQLIILAARTQMEELGLSNFAILHGFCGGFILTAQAAGVSLGDALETTVNGWLANETPEAKKHCGR